MRKWVPSRNWSQVTTQFRPCGWSKAASWPIPSLSAPPSDDGIWRRMRSISSSSTIRNGGSVWRTIILSADGADWRHICRYRFYGFWKVLTASWPQFQLPHRLTPDANAVRIWLTRQTVFLRLASLSNQVSRFKAFRLAFASARISCIGGLSASRNSGFLVRL